MPDPDQLLFDLGRRVAELRRERGQTQQELAEDAGFSVQYLQRIEGGKENLTLRSLALLAELFGVEVVELLAEPADKEPPGPGRPRKGNS